MRITPGPGGSLALLRVPVRDTSLPTAHPVRPVCVGSVYCQCFKAIPVIQACLLDSN